MDKNILLIKLIWLMDMNDPVAAREYINQNVISGIILVKPVLSY
jgi:hypothetical protein